jgi:hypothetical protein
MAGRGPGEDGLRGGRAPRPPRRASPRRQPVQASDGRRRRRERAGHLDAVAAVRVQHAVHDARMWQPTQREPAPAASWRVWPRRRRRRPASNDSRCTCGRRPRRAARSVAARAIASCMPWQVVHVSALARAAGLQQALVP